MALIFTQNLVLSESADLYRPNNPRICIDNVFADGVVTASSESLFDNYVFAENVANGNTFDYWEASSTTAWVQVELPTGRVVDFLGIAAHALTEAGDFVLQYWDGAAWVDCFSPLTVINNDAIGVVFPEIFSSKFRLYITGGISPIGVLFVGKAFVFERGIYSGHTPINFGKNIDIAHSISENGYDLGRAIRVNGVSTEITINNLTATWVRANLFSIIDDMKTKPFFFAWRIVKFPTEVAYVWCDGDIEPSNSGKKDYMNLKFSVKGLINSMGF